LERDAWVRELLVRAHARAAADPALAMIAARITLVAADAREHLAAHAPVDVVLLDPMFPAKRKPDAKPPKAMQALAAVVGSDDDADADALLPLALRIAAQRVVVKRPRQAPPLANLQPAWKIEGKLLRFDVYRGMAAGPRA
ncbi:MAG: class I SAM-dependent methyltransferase, partial [Planctomycetota bacterium]